MKISEIIKSNERTMSFEVFPPKTASAFDSIKAAIEEIALLSPAFMSVTYGAGGGTSRYTVEIAENIEKKHCLPTLAHLTCVSSTRETVQRQIEDMKAAGIHNVMALRGDVPEELLGQDRSAWDYRYAVDLVRELCASAGDFCIGGACYPEIHPESASRQEDILHLREKVDAGCDFLTTQMFFDNDLYYKFLEEARREGINVPIIPGVMPITGVNQVERAIKLSGSYIPDKFLRLVEKYSKDPDSMAWAGIEYATEQMIDLYKNGVTNIHVYTMNKPYVARKIKNNLSDMLKNE